MNCSRIARAFVYMGMCSIQLKMFVQFSDNVILSHNMHAYEYVALMKANEPETAYDAYETPEVLKYCQLLWRFRISCMQLSVHIVVQCTHTHVQ